MTQVSQLFGSCACERNQYTIVFPSASAPLARVFFDNSSANRRAQAAPIAAWLRVPLEWYQSATISQFPDESHGSIKRTFHAPARSPVLATTRRQFCGYCGTHLTAWSEYLHNGGHGGRTAEDYLDVTLGSLLDESIAELEVLQIIPDPEDEKESEEDAADGLVRQCTVNDEDHVPTNEEGAGGVDAPKPTPIPLRVVSQTSRSAPHQMRSRGMPYFEEMVENSRLGRIKRRTGGHTSHDGTTTVEWEVLELGGEDEPVVEVSELSTDPPAKKRQKIGA